MQRRDLLKVAALSGLAGSRAARMLASWPATSSPDEAVHTVLMVAKCHLDVGFTETQAKVMRKYFDLYFPAAMKTASELRRNGEKGYVWTTGSWLLYEYLEQADAAGRRAMEEAVARGDIAWHALPFSWQTEMLDRSMIDGGLGFSHALDRRFGVQTIAAKMTDVPGHTRGLVAPLHDAGVRLLDIGVNGASTPPDVPDFFRWQDPAGKSIAVMYHRHDYGSTLVIPGTGVAVCVEVRGDNSGPHTLEEITALHTRLRTQFPGAQIRPATLNQVAAAVDPVRDRLPLLTSEIGDTWIYGCASDPEKVARFRAAARRRKSWIAAGRFAAGDLTDRELLRRLLLAVEHTWGTDTKTYLDDDHYRAKSLVTVQEQPGYRVMETSWQEKRDDIGAGLATLPVGLRHEREGEFAGLVATPPDTHGMKLLASAGFETRHFNVAWDAATGAITRLHEKGRNIEWASAEHPLLLFTYQTLSAEQYSSFIARYLTIKTDWGPKDFGKPGIGVFGAEARDWHPQMVSAHAVTTRSEERLVLELAFVDAAAEQSGNVAWPRKIFLDLRFPPREARINVRVTTLGKVANRMPEAMWLSFMPAVVDPSQWQVEKVGQMVRAADVVRGGGRAMHAVNDQITCPTPKSEPFRLRTLDAPVVAFGERSPLNFSLEAPDFRQGMHVCLYNNAWGTNYPQWCGGDWVYRFELFSS